MSDKNQQDFLGKKILQNCRNELYLDFPYLDGAFASLEYEADNNISTIATDGEKIYFNPEISYEKICRRSCSGKKRVFTYVAALPVSSCLPETG